MCCFILIIQRYQFYDEIVNTTDEDKEMVFYATREIVRLDGYVEKIGRLVENSGENVTVELRSVHHLLQILREQTCKWVRRITISLQASHFLAFL